MSIDPGAHIIPDLLNANEAVEKVTVVEKNLPMTPWSDSKLSLSAHNPLEFRSFTDPLLHKVG